MDQLVVGGNNGEEVEDKLFKFAERDREVSSQLVLKKVEEVIEGGREEDGAIPVKDMKDRARKSEVGSLDHLSCSKLKDWFDSEDNLEEGKGFCGWVVLKDVFTPHS